MSHIEQTASYLRSMLDMHIETCFRSSRAKGNTKEDNCHTCIRDTMNLAVEAMLEAFDLGVACGPKTSDKERSQIEALKVP